MLMILSLLRVATVAALTLTVSPTVGIAPLATRWRVHLHPSTRGSVCVTLQGPEFARLSCWDVGDETNALFESGTWLNLPPGEYNAWAFTSTFMTPRITLQSAGHATGN